MGPLKKYLLYTLKQLAFAGHYGSGRPSRPGEFHPEPLTDPCLTVSRHTARATP